MVNLTKCHKRNIFLLPCSSVDMQILILQFSVPLTFQNTYVFRYLSIYSKTFLAFLLKILYRIRPICQLQKDISLGAFEDYNSFKKDSDIILCEARIKSCPLFIVNGLTLPEYITIFYLIAYYRLQSM